MSNPNQPQQPSSPGRFSFIVLRVLVGLNLRPALSSLAPLLPRIEREGEFSVFMLSSLTTLPVLCLGLFAPLAPWLSRRFGIERAIAIALLLLSTGLALRGFVTPAALIAGTLFAGAAIGIAGTLLPALVKRELGNSADLMTGVYTMALCLGGALGAGLSIPLADALGSWAHSLMSWASLALIALIAWWWLMPRTAPNTLLKANDIKTAAMLRQPLTWQVMLLMGSQSSLAYIVFGWLPTLLVNRGYADSEAGWLMGISVLVQIVSAFAAPWLARLHRDQRPALLLLLGLVALGLWLLLIASPSLRWFGAIALGLGQGGAFSLALTLIVLRSGNATIAGKLSAIAQGGGYTFAAFGPFTVGLMLEAGTGIDQITWMFFGIIIFAGCLALLAGRLRRLEQNEQGELVTVVQSR